MDLQLACYYIQRGGTASAVVVNVTAVWVLSRVTEAKGGELKRALDGQCSWRVNVRQARR